MKTKKFSKYWIPTIFFISFFFYVFFSNNVKLKSNYRFYIYKNDKLKCIFERLKDLKILKSNFTFYLASKLLNPRGLVHLGSYEIQPGTSNFKIIKILKNGLQKPVELVLHNIQNKENLINIICKRLYIDKKELIFLFNDDKFLKKFGFCPEDILIMFIPNTYNLYWNISSKNLFKRFYDEYNKFWNEKRLQKCQKLNLSKKQVSILASLVASETIIEDEYKTIAGVLINRLKIKMPLQSCPTLKFANNIPKANRVLKKDKYIDSKYNTYKYRGLPPGPINAPSRKSIDSVLNYEKHKYLYMSAKKDFSKRHNFAKTYKEHLNFAKEYQKILNKKKIYR